MASRAALGLSLALACAAGLAGSVMMYTEAPRVLTRIKDARVVSDGQVDEVKWQGFLKDVRTYLALSTEDDALAHPIENVLNTISQYDQDMARTEELRQTVYKATKSEVIREIPSRFILVNHTSSQSAGCPKRKKNGLERSRKSATMLTEFGVTRIITNLPRIAVRSWGEQDAAEIFDLMIANDPGSPLNDDRRYFSWLFKQDEVPIGELIPELMEIPEVKAAVGKKKIWICFRQFMKPDSQPWMVVKDIVNNRDDMLYILSLYTQQEPPPGIAKDKFVFYKIKNRPGDIADGALPVDLYFDDSGTLRYGLQDNSMMYRVLRMQPYGHPSRS
ncbi:MAG: hypothetical protein R2688_04375 [Fimbriimonadaceae bacterium]